MSETALNEGPTNKINKLTGKEILWVGLIMSPVGLRAFVLPNIPDETMTTYLSLEEVIGIHDGTWTLEQLRPEYALNKKNKTSRVPGIVYVRTTRKWKAQYGQKYIGTYNSEAAAVEGLNKYIEGKTGDLKCQAHR